MDLMIKNYIVSSFNFYVGVYFVTYWLIVLYLYDIPTFCYYFLSSHNEKI